MQKRNWAFHTNRGRSATGWATAVPAASCLSVTLRERGGGCVRTAARLLLSLADTLSPVCVGEGVTECACVCVCVCFLVYVPAWTDWVHLSVCICIQESTAYHLHTHTDSREDIYYVFVRVRICVWKHITNVVGTYICLQRCGDSPSLWGPLCWPRVF